MENKDYRNLIISKFNSFECKNLMKKDDECFTKNVHDSRAIRRMGNDFYSKGKSLEKAFQFYTKSIAFAPNDSEDLALAYGNRSALLNKVRRYKESIADINRALKINKIDTLVKLKIMCRKVQCLAAQGSSNAKKVYNEVESLLSKIVDNDNLKFVKKAKDSLNNIRKFNPSKEKEMSAHIEILSMKKAENPFDSIDIKYNKELGKHLSSVRDIKAGEIIFVEKSYVKLFEEDNYLNYCGHCFSKSWTNIPCDYCNWCMFCSEECKNLAWMNYHDIECTTISHLQCFHKINNSDFLSLRSLIIRLKELGSIANFKADNLQFVEEFQDYQKSIQDTVPNSSKTKIDKLINNSTKIYSLTTYAATAAMILVILVKHTSIFEKSGVFKTVHDLKKNKDVLFFGSVFLKLRIISEKSTHIIHNENSVSKLSKDYMICKSSNCCSQGAYIPPISCSILHSCNPNTQLCTTGNNTLIVFALHPIKKNSPLFFANNTSLIESIEEKLTLQNTKSTRHCTSCKQKWPKLLQLYKMPTEEPFVYASGYNKKESDLFDENDELVRPILYGTTVRFDQSTIERLSKAMDMALKYLSQPSVVICELVMCLNIVFDRLYGIDKIC